MGPYRRCHLAVATNFQLVVEISNVESPSARQVFENTLRLRLHGWFFLSHISAMVVLFVREVAHANLLA